MSTLGPPQYKHTFKDQEDNITKVECSPDFDENNPNTVYREYLLWGNVYGLTKQIYCPYIPKEFV